MKQVVKIWQVGKINYSKALQLQRYLANEHQKGSKLCNTLLCVEHPPVYTTGIRSKQYTLAEENKLRNLGAQFYRTGRGGLITFHGPGQLVVYPILNLKLFNPSIKWYVCHIEKCILSLCKKFGLEAETSPHTGIWIKENKVCAIGIHGSRYITTHGLALNCCTDLEWFDHIVPCGIEGKGVTSLTKELNKVVTVEEVLPHFLDSFSNTFKCSYTNMSKEYADTVLSNFE